MDSDPREADWRTNQAATLESLTAFSQRVTRAAPFRMVVIGDPARVDLAALRKIAPVEELTPATVFGFGAFPGPRP
jgi:hypothetical protein